MIVNCERRPTKRIRTESVVKCTSEVWVEQVFPCVAEQSIGEDQVQRTQQQVVGVYQVVADHWEVTCRPRRGKKRRREVKQKKERIKNL